jgi:enoyl-CoA hydratase/carnithine racemase
MSGYTNINYDVDENITYIKFNRSEKLNALTKTMWEEFADALKKADKNNTKLIIISGNEKAFSSGDDIPSMFYLKDQEESINFFQRLENVANFLMDIKKPLIAQVSGIAYGGGFEILLFMDIVIASKDSKFALPEVKLGLIPPFALTVGLSTLGFKTINRLVLIGEAIDVFEAYNIGLVDYIVQTDQLKDKTLEIAWKIISNGPNVSAVKKWSNKHKHKHKEEIKEIIKELSSLALSDQAKIRMQNFIDKKQERISLFC